MPKPRSSGSRRTSTNKSARPFKETRSGGRKAKTRTDDSKQFGGRVKKNRPDDNRQFGGRVNKNRSDDNKQFGGRANKNRSDDNKQFGARANKNRSDDNKQFGGRVNKNRSDDNRHFGGRVNKNRSDDNRQSGSRTRFSGEGDDRSFGQSRQRKSTTGFGSRSKTTKSEQGNDRGKQYSSKPRTSRFGGRAFDDRDERRGPKKSGSFPGKRTSRSRDNQGSPAIQEAPAQTEKIRLNRYIANSGVCSRREADELITMGLISVNGVTITELGYKVNPGDEVRYENKVLHAEKPIYLLLNKPKGYLTTTRDPEERKTVMNLIGTKIKERIYPVGRLDRNTTGLLLLTNDGELADKLMHPSYNVKKIYKVELDRALSQADLEKIREGVRLEEGRAMVDDVAIASPDGRTVGLEIHIGWNRVVRRIFETLGYEVMKLDRTVYAGLDKKDLPRGEWRHLRKEEIVRLKHYK